MMQIDEITYKVKDINRYKNQSPKTQIVLATSLRKDSYHITRLLHKEFGKTKKWNTYTISRNGLIYNHYDPKHHSDFLGIKEGDKQSVSIVLENMGCLSETINGEYVNTINEVCDKSNVVERKWLDYNYWEQFTDAQITSTVELCKELCEKYGIPKILIDFHHYHKDTTKFRGIVFKSNYIENSSDINPLFDIGKFNEMLHNEFI